MRKRELIGAFLTILLWCVNSARADSFTVSGGASGGNLNGKLGDQTNDSWSVGLVTDPGSKWGYVGSLYVGNWGWNNSLIITNGGLVTNTDWAFVGYMRSSCSNAVTVANSNSLWRVGRILYMGDYGSDNTLQILNGASGHFTQLYVGSIGSNNLAVVSDPGSLLISDNTVFLGDTGPSNSLQIINKGVLRTDGGIFVAASPPNKGCNYLLVSGEGSRVEAAGGIDLGKYGPSNLLRIENGAKVLHGPYSYSSVGDSSSNTSNNTVIVSGPGSEWIMTAILCVYDKCRLVIENGGFVSNDMSEIRFARSEVLVTGAGSRWDNGNRITLEGTNSVINVNSGAVVRCTDMGIWAHGLLRVDGEGSQLTNRDDFDISFGYGRAEVTGGAEVHGDQCLFQNTGQQIWVDGTGSLWRCSGPMILYGVSNSLLVTGGACLENAAAFLGAGISPTGCTATISGPGSRWLTRGTLTLGAVNGAYGNQMTVTDGGSVSSLGGVLGLAYASNSSVTISGSGSEWNCASNLTVGVDTSRNWLSVTDGGRLIVTNGTGTATLNVSRGEFNIDQGVTVVADSIRIDTNGTLVGTGTLTGSATVAGLLSPGGTGAVGSLAFSSNLILSASAGVNVRVMGPSSNDQLFAAGDFAAAGKLRLHFDYAPLPQDYFVIATATGAVSGGFTVEWSGKAVGGDCGFVGHSYVVSNITVDTDEDAMPDNWEQDFFGNATNAAPDSDGDGDGSSNLAEYLAGTNPTNGMERLYIDPIANPFGDYRFVISWMTVSGKRYAVVTATNLLTPSWIPVPSSNWTNVTGNGSALIYTNTQSQPDRRFFRIRLIP